jgi:hypothetical protein
MAQPSSQPQLDLTDSEVPEQRTRSGRVSKPPVRYEPVEQVEDDYASEDYDTEEHETDEENSDVDSEDISDEEDADEDGNLDGFVVPDKSESDEDDNGPPVVPVKKRPTTGKRVAGRTRA